MPDDADDLYPVGMERYQIPFELKIEAAISTLADLTTEEHEVLHGATRDDIDHVIFALEQIMDERRRRR